MAAIKIRERDDRRLPKSLMSLPGPSLLLHPQATPDVFSVPVHELAFPSTDWEQTQGAVFSTLHHYFETHLGCVCLWFSPFYCRVVVYGMNIPPFGYPLTCWWVGDVSSLGQIKQLGTPMHRCSDEHILHFSWVNKYLGVEWLDHLISMCLILQETISQRVGTIWHPHQWGVRIPVPAPHRQPWARSVLFPQADRSLTQR